MGLSRRQLISRLAATGGYGAAFSGMQALGLLSATPAQVAGAPAEAFQAKPQAGQIAAARAAVASAHRTVGLIAEQAREFDLRRSSQG